MNTKPQCIIELENLLRDTSAAVRAKNKESIEFIVVQMGQKWEDYRYLARPLTKWPDRDDPTNLYRYLLKFNFMESQDNRDYLATATELQLLLKYTPASLKVAFGTGRGKIDRSARPTKLGACVVHRLDKAVELSEHPHALLLGDRELKQRQENNRYKRFGKPEEPLTYKTRGG